jgi:hypothetical protein
MKTQFIFCITILLPFLVLGQLKSTHCEKVKTGNFYFYPPKSQKGFLIIRDNTTQKEINLQTGDTSFWRINWQSPCAFTLSFLKKSQPVSNEELSFYNSHKTVVEILAVTKDGYVFKGGLDNMATSNVTDTLWFKKREL